ncbi:MAG: oligosaccharyl transferase, archaeosortase A system-associated, partial [Methanomicrobiales archaeon]|nr:oligosaccharyl transferase, archaeosortase A system-associated [Methanomicrobiales archaeon]
MSHQITRHFSLCIVAILILLSALCLYVRITPIFLGNTDVISFLALDDPIYNLRQIEQMSMQFPHYNWFEALTSYPTGTIIHWGPLFTMICTSLVLLMGATTRPEIVSIALFVPPIMAACLVPVSYAIGKKLLDWKAGLIAALFMALIPGQHYARSFYGYLDHHTAETLFSALFCLCYILALWSSRDKKIELRQLSTWKPPVLYGLICGFAYFLGYANMPTMILFGLITSIFTLLWFIAERLMKNDGLYLAILNTVTFGVSILGSIIVGFPESGLALSSYTIMQPLVMATIIVSSWALFFLSYYLQKKSILHYIGSIVAFGAVGAVLSFLLLPSLFNSIVGNARVFFSQGGLWVTIMEARPWTVADAWGTFSYSLFFFIFGLLVCLFFLYRTKHPIYSFTFIWSVLILFATFSQIRYEYYLAVPISVQSGLFFGFLLNTTLETIQENGGLKRALTKTKRNSSKQVKSALLLLSLVIFGIAGGVFIYNSYAMESRVSPLNLNLDWRLSLMWMEENTPDPGIDYYMRYDGSDWANLRPAESYGVLSWWDYGHMIQYFAKRPSVANPFQQGVHYAAPFFTTGSEDRAREILDATNTKYVITDAEMATVKFWAMATWEATFDSTAIGLDGYQRTYFLASPDNKTSYLQFSLYEDPFYHSMTSRLHLFDGSYVPVDNSRYVEFTEQNGARVVTFA